MQKWKMKLNLKTIQIKDDNMKKLIALIAIITTLFAIKAYACYTQTYIVNGKIINCTTCGNVTNCF
jgi:hypothetical protein